MCVLVVPDELKALQRALEEQQQLEKAKKYSEQFERYWQRQALDEQSLVAMEKEQDRSFLSMIRHQPIPKNMGYRSSAVEHYCSRAAASKRMVLPLRY